MKNYDHKKIEKKWQGEWAKKKIYQAKDFKGDKFYSLVEFPYPSGDGLHVGHPRPYIGMDIISRKKRMEGKNVLFPMGWDAFGLPAENYAIKTGKQPSVITKKNSDNFRRQIQSLGISFDWSREINTTDPNYYKWTQWLFLQFLKKGLAYKAKSEINWCPKDKCGLANEEVIDGKCERCGTPTVKKEKEQWMLAITKYAERLDKDLDLVDYPERVKSSQRNWIGKSEGSEIDFEIKSSPSLTLPEGKGKMPGYLTADPKSYKLLYESSVEMRKNPTKAETILWKALKGNKEGFHFRQQHIINNFIVDLVCLSKKLVVEIDGDIHDLQKEKDFERTKILEIFGFKVIRFKNEEILSDLGKVVRKISETLKNPSLREGQGWALDSLGRVKVFTTRADTLFGATYVVLAPEHQLVQNLKLQITNWNEVEKYISDVNKKSDLERTENKEKTGVELKGIKAINPANNEEIPIYIADYVLAGYGTGAVMAVPAHDERDFEFAKKYELPIRQVIAPHFLEPKNPPQKDKPTKRRKTIHIILERKSDSKVLMLDWIGKEWGSRRPHTFIMGGVEEGEDVFEAAKREVEEETGYFNLKSTGEINLVLHTEYYAAHKLENRYADISLLHFILENEEQRDIDPEELKKHIPTWIEKNKIIEFTNVTDGPFEINWFNDGPSAIVDDGIVINSRMFSNLNSEEARTKITEFVGGKMVTKFKLRDWVFSRQRYWGEPIPVVNCENCGLVPVKEKDLPVKLPPVKSYKPTDSGESPLAGILKWVNTKCPKCGGKAKRETDTMPNWAGSSWYYLRYTDSKNKKEFASKKNLKYWTPVDWYNGGMEHTTLHLLYSRFWHKFLFDLKLVPTVEPYKKRTSHGMILGEGGVKMSKSLGNVVNPDEIVKTYGADTLRVYEMFIGPFEDTAVWNTESIIGSRRFIEKVWRIGEKVLKQKNSSGLTLPGAPGGTHTVPNSSISKLLNKTIKKVGEDIEAMRFNTAISAMMILATEMEKREFVDKEDYKKFLKILAPFAPHISEDIWHSLGEKKFINISAWPKYDEKQTVDDEIKIAVQVNGKTRAEIIIATSMNEDEIKEFALKEKNVISWIENREIKRVIYVPGRIINIVV